MNHMDTEIYISPKLQRKHLRGFGGYRGTSINGANFVVGSCAQHRVFRVEERGEVQGSPGGVRTRGLRPGRGPGGRRAGPGGRTSFPDGVLGSPGLGPGGCHTGTWTAEAPGKRGSMMSLWMWSEGDDRRHTTSRHGCFRLFRPPRRLFCVGEVRRARRRASCGVADIALVAR